MTTGYEKTPSGFFAPFMTLISFLLSLDMPYPSGKLAGHMGLCT